MSVAPSGEQVVVERDGTRAVLVGVGGGIRELTVGGRPVLDGYAEDAICDGARGQTLVPWPNRVKDGEYAFGGTDYQLSLTEPPQHTAIHGLARWSQWDLSGKGDGWAELTTRIAARPEYPWTVDVSNRWEIDGDGIRCTTTITNQAATAAPVGVGFHPYLTVGTPTVDDATLHLPVATRLPTGDQQIPTGTEPVEGTEYDFRIPRAIGDTEIDFAFTDLERDGDGRFELTLTAPDGDAVVLWLGDGYDWVEVFTGDSLPDPSRRRQGLGVEPMSMPPNALATGEGVVALEPGASWQATWGVQARYRA